MKKLKDQFSFIIFDWDGTLMDSTGRIVSAMRATAKAANIEQPSEQAVKSIIGLSMKAVMETLFPEADDKLKAELVEIYRYQYVHGDSTPSPLFEGTLPLLNWLKQEQISIAIATGKARAGLERVLGEVGLSDYFDHSICADEAESKPHPQMVEQLLHRAKKNQQETLLLGDSIHDLKMACNAGISAVGVTSGANNQQQLQQFEPLAILERICHLQQWLRS